MTLRVSHEALRCWRPAREGDLPAIMRLAAAIHPDYPERPDVFADRLRLHPTGMLLAVLDGEPVGYAIGHPWRGAPPLLDRPLGVLPDRPDRYWLHDLAVSPPARSRRLGRAALMLLEADAAQAGSPQIALVAVGAARPFWQAAGFTATPDPVPPCYGSGATLMRRSIA